MLRTNSLPHKSSHLFADRSGKVSSIAFWDSQTESNLITRIYESVDDVALWFPESIQSDVQDETITIYQIISWLKETLEILEQGKSVRVRPYGNSMKGIIKSGQLVELVPAPFHHIETGDVVLVRWDGNYLWHQVLEIGENRLLIGNNRGKIRGWVTKAAIIAKVAQVFREDGK